MNDHDTIVALATSHGRAAVSIVRLSGSDSLPIATQLCRKALRPRYATFAPLILAGLPIDTGLWIYFKGPNSFTGEDIVEFQGHGGPIVVQEILKIFIKCGARLAMPGEFSQRAFMNNKIDLTQAEAISDLINATSVVAARAAQSSLTGVFGKKINFIVEQLIHLRTQIEAHIDFPDEDISPQNIQIISSSIREIATQINYLLTTASEGVKLNRTSSIVLVGRPNAGKSSLLNALAKTPLAIVTNIPGTTRDILKYTLILNGLELTVIDTAGIRKTDSIIEHEGIRRARQEIISADLTLCLIDGDINKITNDEITSILGQTKANQLGIVRTKMDLHQSSIDNQTNFDLLEISSITGQGLDKLTDWLTLQLGLHHTSDNVFSARFRHVEHLREAFLNIQSATENSLITETIELLAEDLRLTQKQLSKITGEFSSDDLLTSIFSTFCIGK